MINKSPLMCLVLMSDYNSNLKETWGKSREKKMISIRGRMLQLSRKGGGHVRTRIEARIRVRLRRQGMGSQEVRHRIIPMRRAITRRSPRKSVKREGKRIFTRGVMSYLPSKNGPKES